MRAETPDTKEERKKLVEELDIKLGIMRAGRETQFWKELVEIMNEKINYLKRDIEKYRKEQILKVPPQEFVNNLISMEKLLEALEKLKRFPDILCEGLKNSIESIQTGFRDPNFITRLFKGVKQKEK